MVLLLVAYDVNTQTKEGESRLRKVAKTCEAYGMRVQNSLFECDVDPKQRYELEFKLKKIIEETEDSLLIYDLGNNYTRRIQVHGHNPKYFNVKDDLIDI